MKTSTSIIYAPAGFHEEGDKPVEIRTTDGHLKANMLTRILEHEGENVHVPSSLALEILKSRTQLKKIARRRTRQRDALAEYAEGYFYATNEALYYVEEMRDMLATLLEKTELQHIRADIEAVKAVGDKFLESWEPDEDEVVVEVSEDEVLDFIDELTED